LRNAVRERYGFAMSRYAFHLPRHWVAASLLGAASLTLAGCGDASGLSRTFGLTRDTPDEFAVTTQAPLSMPPDMSIRPPRPGAPRPQDVSDSTQAEAALVPQTSLGTAPAGMSPGQQALIAQAGPPAPANIRAEVSQEAVQANSRGFADRLMFWRPAPPPGIVVDPTREAQRLRENAALGQTPEAGQTPIIQPKPRGWLQGIF
jgi:hypothetical protein